jgi:hypothetical protein
MPSCLRSSPPTSVSIARQRAVHCRGRRRLFGGGGGGGSRGCVTLSSARGGINGGAIKLRVILVSQFLVSIRRPTGVSHLLLYLSAHQKRSAQVSISSGTQNVKNVSDMRVDSSLQKKNGKINKSTSTILRCSSRTPYSKIFSESTSGTIVHKNKKRIMAGTHYFMISMFGVSNNNTLAIQLSNVSSSA